MKGQMYLILAIVTVTVLIVLRLSLNLADILENNRRLQANLENLELENIERGIKQALINSYTLPNRSSNVDFFIDFVRSSESSRGNQLAGLSIQSTYPNVTANSEITMNTSIYNFLGLQIENLTVVWNYNGSSKTFVNVDDNTTKNMQFGFNINSNVEHILSVNYTVSNVAKTKNVIIPLEIGKSKFIGYYIIEFSTAQSTPATEFTHIVNLNQTQYT